MRHSRLLLGLLVPWTMARSVRLAVIAGDGIGPEVVAEGVKGARRGGSTGTTSNLSAPSTTSAPGVGTPLERRCRSPRLRRFASTTPSCSVRWGIRQFRAACSSAVCSFGCALSWTTTSTFDR